MDFWPWPDGSAHAGSDSLQRIVIAVEAADCLMVGDMHPVLAAAMPRVMDVIREIVAQ